VVNVKRLKLTLKSKIMLKNKELSLKKTLCNEQYMSIHLI